MVILFSGRKSSTEKEIIDILTSYGANYISDKKINLSGKNFTIISEYKKTDMSLKNGIAVFIDDTERFNGQTFPKGIIGICENHNQKALNIFKDNLVPVISCGMSPKSTITISSINDDSLLAALQRTIVDFNGFEIEPLEIKINLTKAYNPFSVMASAAVLLLMGITPDSF